MSENLERKSTDFVRLLIEFLCIFCPGTQQNFFIVLAGAPDKAKSLARAGPGLWSIQSLRQICNDHESHRQTLNYSPMQTG